MSQVTRSKRVGVILSGAGVYDGSELHEAVLTLLALDRAGATVQCFAPDVSQLHVINHLTGQVMPESRNVLVEAARIARGNIHDVTKANILQLDAVILPGGYGAAKNLCTFATQGAECDIQADVAGLLRAAFRADKPIGVMCIAPAVLARAMKGSDVQVTLTIGDDAGTAAGIEALGARHQNCPPGEIVVDDAHKIVSTPAYMYDSPIAVVAKGIDALVARVLELA